MEAFKTIEQVHDAFEEGTLSPVEFTKEYLARAKNDKLNAFLTVEEERALAQAKNAESVLHREGHCFRDKYPLLGIPLGIKDVLAIEGVRTTCGSKILENYVAPYSATAVKRLEAAGAVVLGKLNMDEFAMGGSNENSAYGPVQHPLKPGYVPGGSSGGSAAAVRAGLCMASLGTDTGGSIRLPASYCGVVGLKPTYGRVSRYGLVAFASSLDQVGPMANHVEDVAILLDVMGGHDPLDSTSSPREKEACLPSARREPDWSRLRIGVPREYFVNGVQDDVLKSINDALRWFESKGAKLVDVSLPHTKYSVAVYYIVAVSEASSNLARYDGVRFGVRPNCVDECGDLSGFYRSVRGLFGAEVKRRILLGTFALSSGYYDAYYKRACQVRRLIKNDFDAAFKEVDYIAAPVSPTTAFKLGEKVEDPLKMYLNDIFTIPVNLSGLPALSVPCGADASGLPIGLHLIAPHFGDGALLSLANAFEKRGRTA